MDQHEFHHRAFLESFGNTSRRAPDATKAVAEAKKYADAALEGFFVVPEMAAKPKKAPAVRKRPKTTRL